MRANRQTKRNLKRKTQSRKQKRGGGPMSNKPIYAFDGWQPSVGQMKRVSELLGDPNYTVVMYDADLRIIEENIVHHSKNNAAKTYVGRQACSGGCNYALETLDLNGPPGFGGPGRASLRCLAEYVITELIDDVIKGRVAGSLLNPK